ncbi:MAG: metal-dependent transcriptional regulator [Fibrobacterota bacterium]
MLSSSLEDYLEAVLEISRENGVARTKQISSRLNVKSSSVTAALKTLNDQGYVNYKPYGFITLTDRGVKRAEVISSRHGVLKRFLEKILGISESEAEKTACGMEHVLGAETAEKLESLTKHLLQDKVLLEKVKSSLE